MASVILQKIQRKWQRHTQTHFVRGRNCTCRTLLWYHEYHSELPEYQYQPLSGPGCIRVFELQHGQEKDPIQGTFKEIDLDRKHRDFQALSYTWMPDGTPSQKPEAGQLDADSVMKDAFAWSVIEKPHTILCGQSKMAVTCSVYSALLRIRQPGKSVFLFVDAISIDQAVNPSSLNERAVQIKLMGRIFGQAEKVIADLGDQDDEAELIIDDLITLASVPHPVWEEIKESNFDLQYRSLPALKMIKWDLMCKPLVALCRRKWWRRIWIIQEAKAARTITFLIGKRFIHEERVLTGLRRIGRVFWKWADPYIQYDHQFLNELAGLISHVCGIFPSMTAETPHHQGAVFTLAWLLKVSRKFEATVPHDRIFGLLGIARLEDTAMLEIDYSQAIDALVLRVSLSLARPETVVYLLHHLAGYDLDDHKPSWSLAIDRSDDGDRDVHLFGNLEPQDYIFRAGGLHKPLSKGSEDGSCLHLTGLLLGNVQRISSRAGTLRNDTPENERANLMWYRSLLKFSQDAHSPAAGSEDIISPHILWETAVAGYRNTTPLGPNFRGDLHKHTRKWQEWIKAYQPGSVGISSLEPETDLHDFLVSLSVCCSMRRIGSLSTGNICLLPGDTRTGDMVAIFLGFPTPFVVREKGEHYRLVGSAYVHGVMDGEAVQSGLYQEQEIVLC